MKKKGIKDNDCLLNSFSESFTILSAKICDIRIYSNKEFLVIDILFELIYPKYKYFILKFIDVKKFSFSWSDDYIFYNVESFKLFKQNDYYHISLDPYNEYENISDNDRDFILSKKIQGYYSENPNK